MVGNKEKVSKPLCKWLCVCAEAVAYGLAY